VSEATNWCLSGKVGAAPKDKKQGCLQEVYLSSMFEPDMKVLLVYPKTPDTFWNMRHALKFICKRATMPPLGLLTVAALLPKHWDLRLVDMNVGKLTEADLKWADYVFLSAMLIQKESAEEVIGWANKFGKPVVAGGPLFTTSPNLVNGRFCLVRGEAEEIISELVLDMELGQLKPEYRAAKFPDLKASPAPRWDLVKFNHYAAMPVQFSRGCPFNCEFCDIVVMFGRVPRVKTPQQVITELEVLRGYGWDGGVFLVDDNFIGNKRSTRQLLLELIEWRRRNNSKMTFMTEASINLADDPELCRLMVEAGFRKVFVGIETPAPESLEECGKFQNKSKNLEEAVHALQRCGLEVMGGFIVGFDSDPKDIFRRQFQFIQKTGIAAAMVGLLTALPGTRLWNRLMAEGRIIAESTGNNTATVLNFIPKLGREFLVQGYASLMNALYEPKLYYQRVKVFLENYHPPRLNLTISWVDVLAFLKSIWVLGIRDKGRFHYWKLLFATLLRRPRIFPTAVELAIMGYHFRQIARNLRAVAMA